MKLYYIFYLLEPSRIHCIANAETWNCASLNIGIIWYYHKNEIFALLFLFQLEVSDILPCVIFHYRVFLILININFFFHYVTCLHLCHIRDNLFPLRSDLLQGQIPSFHNLAVQYMHPTFSNFAKYMIFAHEFIL